ncbi:DUF58 domain-containing protein [Pleurocapsales cyanobacterium LEGE 10410]|nr:DUF58 domain-containing protein [Pleurocapsales cyanobacterium LEGE 10410]
MKFLYHLFCLGYKVQQWLLKRFTSAGLAILVSLVATVIVGIDTKQTVTYQVFAFMIATLIIAVTFSCYFPARFDVQRQLPRFATVGSRLFYRVAITNRNQKLQAGLLFIEEIADPKFSLTEFKQIITSNSNKGSVNSLTYIYYRWLCAIAQKRKAKTKAIALPSLKPNSTTEIRGEITPTHRGVVRLQGITILRPDPFNLFNATKTVKQAGSLLVLPKRYQLPVFNLPGSRRSQSGSVSLASSVGDSEEFISLRDYRPGDPLNKIHWKSWAKTGKPVVKEEKSEYFVRHALILDTFQSQKHSEILEEAVAVAASFAWDFHTQESLLDLMFVGLESYCFTTGRGLGSKEQMLEILAGVTACQDNFDCLMAAVVEKVSMLSGCICILISWDQQRRKLVNYLRGFKIPLLVLLITENEQQHEDLNLENLYVLPLGKIQAALMNIRSI